MSFSIGNPNEIVRLSFCRASIPQRTLPSYPATQPPNIPSVCQISHMYQVAIPSLIICSQNRVPYLHLLMVHHSFPIRKFSIFVITKYSPFFV